MMTTTTRLVVTILLLLLLCFDIDAVVFTDDTLRPAVRLWVNNQSQAMAVYGNIADWDTSQVTQMNVLFATQSNFPANAFNDDITKWDTSQVVTMAGMFDEASSFNQDIGNWNVGSVKSMFGMFARALEFNQDLEKWDTSNVEDMQSMFVNCPKFNGNISTWDVSSVETMTFMFRGATSFQGNLNAWNVEKVQDMVYMMEKTLYENMVCFEKLMETTNVTGMFCNSPASFEANCPTVTLAQVQASSLGCEETMAPSSTPSTMPSMATRTSRLSRTIVMLGLLLLGMPLL